MRETFSSVPTAHDASLSLSFSFLPSFSLSFCFSRRYTGACAHAYACLCVCMYVCVCVYVADLLYARCVSLHRKLKCHGVGWGGRGGGHRRRWTARDAARRESLKEIETARPLCLLVYTTLEREREKVAGQGGESFPRPVFFFLLRQSASSDDISESHAVVVTLSALARGMSRRNIFLLFRSNTPRIFGELRQFFHTFLERVNRKRKAVAKTKLIGINF